MLYSILSISGSFRYIIAETIEQATRFAKESGIDIKSVEEVTEAKEEIYGLL